MQMMYGAVDEIVPERVQRELPDALVLIAADGSVRYWGTGAQRVFGYRSEEAMGRPYAELTVPLERRAELGAMIDCALEQGLVTYESVRFRKDASLLYVDITCKALRDPVGNPEILITEKDVTRIKVTRDARLMEARFRDLLESTPDGIVMANPTGHIVIANSEAERLFAYLPGELLGMSVDELLPERYRQAHVGHRSNYFLQPRKRAMGSGLDLSGLRKDGTEFPIEISLSPLRTEESAFVMSAIRDISERRRFEQTLKEKNLELAAANRAKDHFLAGMSHELRTPLNAIIGFTGTLLMRLSGPLNDDQDKQLRTVQSSARHLLSLINDLLDIAKIESGKISLELTPIDCCAMLEEVHRTLATQALAKGLSFRVQLPEQPLRINSDPRAVRQIVLNLTSNALKFTDSGEVVLRLRSMEQDSHPRVEIDVADSGIGISKQDQARLFTAFSRIVQPGSGSTEGTGLGLHLSLKLAQQLGGDIRLRSQPGVGSVFTLSLPLE